MDGMWSGQMAELAFSYIGYEARGDYKLKGGDRISWEAKFYRANRFIGEASGEIPHDMPPFAGVPVTQAVRRAIQQTITDIYGTRG